MELHPQEDSVDVARLQLLLSTDYPPDPPEVQIQASPTASRPPPVTPARGLNGVLEVSPNTPPSNEHTTTTTTTTSDDRTGSLRLAYSGPSYSQVDFGDTQVDSESLQQRALANVFQVKNSQDDIKSKNPSSKTQESVTHIPPSSCPLSTPSRQLNGSRQDDDNANDFTQGEREAADYYPEAERFESPIRLPTSTPAKPQSFNPLAGLFAEKRAGEPSLTQVFNAKSSPRSAERPKTNGIPSPPTPGDPAAIMARSFIRADTLYHTPGSPLKSSATPRRSSSVPTTVPTQPLSSYDTAQENREERGRFHRTWKQPMFSSSPRESSKSRSPSPARSISPVVFSQSKTDEIAYSQDSLFSASSNKRRRAEAARKAGEEQLKTVLGQASVRMGRAQSALPRSNKRKKPQMTSRTTPSKAVRIEETVPEFTNATESVSDCGSSTQEVEDIPQDVTLPEDKVVQVDVLQSRTAPNDDNVSTVPTSSATMHPKVYRAMPELLDEDWEAMHGVRPKNPRRIRSASALKTSTNLMAPKLKHAYTQPVPEMEGSIPSTLSNEGRKVSARQFPPFNLNVPQRPPTPHVSSSPAAPVPAFVKESSNLELPPDVPPTQPLPGSSLTPLPSSSAEPPVREVMRSSPPPTGSNDGAVPKTPFPAQKIARAGVRNEDTTIPETSPYEREAMLTPMAKQRPESHLSSGDVLDQRDKDSSTREEMPVGLDGETEDVTLVPCTAEEETREKDGREDLQPPSQLRSFSAVDESNALFSSREEPDEVDMVAIVQSVGAGADRDLEVPAIAETPSQRKRKMREKPLVKSPGKAILLSELDENGRPPKRAKTSSAKPKAKAIATKAKDKLGKATKTGVASAKILANKLSGQQASKQRASTLRQVSSLPDTPTLNTSVPGPDTEDSASDILASTSPSFLISRSMESRPVVAPHRVFALFKDSKLYYHPATLISCDSETQVRVSFDDGTQDVLERHNVRSLDIRVGDTVKIDLPNMKKHLWIVKSFPKPSVSEQPVTPGPNNAQSTEDALTDIRGHSLLIVSGKNASVTPGGDVEVPLTKIYLIKSLWSQFASRDAIRELMPIAGTTQLNTPSVSMSSAVTPTRGNRRGTPAFAVGISTKNGLFANMLFALTLGSKDGEKKGLTSKILANGGRILEAGFEDLFFDVNSEGCDDESSVSRSSSREPGSVSGTDMGLLTPRLEAQNVGFACVLADRHSTRPKFLQALALGLPCLAYRWVEDCVKKGRVLEWDTYLLPAGESKYLGDGVVKSRVLLPFDASNAIFRDIIQSRKRVFDGLNVIVVTGKLGAAEKQKAYTFLTNALGAASIAKVKTLDAAKKIVDSSSGGRWDTIIVGRAEKEKAVKMWRGKEPGIRIMDEEGLKENLILGRLEF